MNKKMMIIAVMIAVFACGLTGMEIHNVNKEMKNLQRMVAWKDVDSSKSSFVIEHDEASSDVEYGEGFDEAEEIIDTSVDEVNLVVKPAVLEYAKDVLEAEPLVADFVLRTPIKKIGNLPVTNFKNALIDVLATMTEAKAVKNLMAVENENTPYDFETAKSWLESYNIDIVKISINNADFVKGPVIVKAQDEWFVVTGVENGLYVFFGPNGYDSDGFIDVETECFQLKKTIKISDTNWSNADGVAHVVIPFGDIPVKSGADIEVNRLIANGFVKEAFSDTVNGDNYRGGLTYSEAIHEVEMDSSTIVYAYSEQENKYLILKRAYNRFNVRYVSVLEEGVETEMAEIDFNLLSNLGYTFGTVSNAVG